MCAKWPCCDQLYTVRRYHADGRTAWVRSYGRGASIPDFDLISQHIFPADAVSPIDVVVGTDGRVIVCGPHVVVNPRHFQDWVGDDRWDVRCWSADGQPLWYVDLMSIEAAEWHGSFSGVSNGILQMVPDGAGGVFVLAMFNAEEVQNNRRFVFHLSADGEVLSTSVTPVIVVTQIASAADGRWQTMDEYLAFIVLSFEVRDFASVGLTSEGLAAWLTVGEVFGLYGTAVIFATDADDYPWLDVPPDYLWLRDGSFSLSGLGVAANESGLAVIRGNDVDGAGHQLCQIAVNPLVGSADPPYATRGAIGAVQWAKPCRIQNARRQIAMSRFSSRTAVLLDGHFNEPVTGLRRPSLAVLDASGNVLWSHFHHDRLEIAIGDDDTVATIGNAQRLGIGEWEHLNSLQGQ